MWGVMKKFLSLALMSVAVLFSSCRQYFPLVYGVFEEKTIAMPLHNVGDSASMKHQLRELGWEISVSGLTEGATEKNGEKIKFANAQARYTMDWKIVFGAYSGGWQSHARPIGTSIVVFENRTGKEILNYSGPFNWTKTVTRRLVDALENRKPENER